ncbi:MAG: 3-keto-5-aminohexanoate cleavage protein [Pirellulaceae bacterium]
MNSEKLIINAAITGMVPMKTDSPHVPITPEEILADVRRCYNAGASVVHVHARGGNGEPHYKQEIYDQIICGIREEIPQLIISGSTSGRVHKEFSQRSEVLNSRPDLASLTVGSLNFPQQASVNEPKMIQALATAMRERGIVPELEFFDLGMIDYAHFLVQRGFLTRPFYGNLLLGSLGTLGATPDNLLSMVRALPEGMTWSATGIGRFQWQVHTWALTMGGHVRVGLEDSLYYDVEKTRLATNAGLIDRVVNLSRAVGREIAAPRQARAMIGIPLRETVGKAA